MPYDIAESETLYLLEDEMSKRGEYFEYIFIYDLESFINYIIFNIFVIILKNITVKLWNKNYYYKLMWRV